MKKINSNLFKKAMSRFATGITIITINKRNEYMGKTVNSFASLSLDPPMILFSLDKKSTSINKYKSSNYIGINILSTEQKELCNYFSKKNPKWNIKEYFLMKNNIPMIKNSLCNINCKLNKKITQGDHFIFICQILEIKINKKSKPLVYFDSKYH